MNSKQNKLKGSILRCVINLLFKTDKLESSKLEVVSHTGDTEEISRCFLLELLAIRKQGDHIFKKLKGNTELQLYAWQKFPSKF